MKFFKKFIIVLSLISIISFGTFKHFFVHKEYKPTSEVNSYLVSSNEVEVLKEDEYLVFKPSTIKAGIIFYPGACVNYVSYAPLMHKLSDKGFLCVLLHAKDNFALIDKNKADGIKEMYEEVDDWYLAGHSLGGVVASNYLSENLDEYKGLILLASYTTKDFCNENTNVLSIYGSLDSVLNIDKVIENRKNVEGLNNNYLEVVIDGGNHAYFGMYGTQKGDNDAQISNLEQLDKTVEIIDNYIN